MAVLAKLFAGLAQVWAEIHIGVHKIIITWKMTELG